MGLIEIVLILVIVGVVIGGLQKVPWIDPTFIPIIRIVVILALAIWLWQVLGFPDIPVGKVAR